METNQGTEEPGRPVIRLVREHRVLTVLVLLLAAGAVAAVVWVLLPPDYGEQIAGPFGAFPTSLNTASRGGAPQMIPTTTAR